MRAKFYSLMVLLLWVLMAVCPILYAQNTLSLMFTGVDQNNEYVRINSVTIENLTRGWSETILFPDTIYTMEVGTGLEDYLEEGRMQVMPNPFDGHTRVNISSAQSEPAKMVLVDINGRKCAEYAGTLVCGDNYFEISLTTPQVYVLSVTTSSGTRSLKMVNKGHAGADRILSDGNTEKYAKVDLRSTLAHDFELGDEMCYKGFASHNGHQIQSEGVTQQQFMSETFDLRFNLGSEAPLIVQTDSIHDISHGLRCYGTVLSGEGVTVRGFCWSTSPHPTLANDYTVEVGGLGGFSSQLTGLDDNQCYFLRAYATNNDGTTTYGNEFRFCLTTSYAQIDTIFIPDGKPCHNGVVDNAHLEYCSYVSSVTITGYPISSTIQSANDILYVRLKIEHSFIGDLWIRLICPNNNYVSIMKKYGSGSSSCSGQIPASEWGWSGGSNSSDAHFGIALDDEASGDEACNPNNPENAMGTPWNYCWSDATNQGYQYAPDGGYVYRRSNVHNNRVDSTNVAQMTNVYHPDGTFANLVGCPLNGEWSIEVIDGFSVDNGWITDWELVLDTAMAEHYGVILSSVDTVLPELSTSCPGVAVVTDYDGNRYNTVQIGNQCWIKENLRTTHYVSGESITIGTDADTVFAHYYLPEVIDSAISCGYLYNWKAVMGKGSGSAANPSGVQGICPSGWHVPSDAEWVQLTDYMSGLAGYVCGENPSNIAQALAADTIWHSSGNSCAVGYDLSLNNISGFSALPAGYVCEESMGYGTSAKFWTTTSNDDAHAYYRALHYNNSFLEPNSFGDKGCGMSVRCVLAEAPRVTTAAVTDIQDSTAVSGGEVISIGGAPVTERGLCWSTHTYPNIEDAHIESGSGLGAFTGQMTGLTPGIAYYVRAYATNAAGTVYGDQKTFIIPSVPMVATGSVTDILGITATCSGEVLSECGAPVTARGVCWSTLPNPDISDCPTTDDGSGTGYFSSQMTGLTPNTPYFVRAYATNNIGTAYGVQVSFTTKDVPTVTLDSATNILSISAFCKYHVTNNGGLNLIDRGICYATTPNPTLNDHVVIGTSNTATVELTELTPGTTYYVRAFATNDVGIGYSNEITFTTLTIPTLTTTSVSDISFFTATGGGEVLATGVPDITERGVCWSTSHNPTVADSHTVDSTGFGVFSSQLMGLDLHTTYYVRAYATNSSGTGYGNECHFITLNIPAVTTKTVTDILGSTAICGGNVTSDGGGTLLAKGVCWSMEQNPTIDDNLATDTSALTNYTCVMSGLTPSTTYYVRAFATNGGGTAYGTQKSFTTKTFPTVVLDSVTNILSLTASCTYHVTANGGLSVTARGICYSTMPNPTISDSVIAGTANNGKLELSGLIPGTIYYVRAFATNGVGTGYSNEISFTTLTIPSLTTAAVSDISFFTATAGGEVLATGVPEIIERGCCWSTSHNPTIADNHTVDSVGFEVYSIQMTGLNPQTTYYVRAYATNSSGTGYGNEVAFTTLNYPSVTTNMVTNITNSSATCGGNVTNTGGGPLVAKGICWGTTPQPTIDDITIVDTTALNSFTCIMTGLTPGVTYYVRAFATNDGGIAYGAQRSFTTKSVPTVSLDSVFNVLNCTASCTYHVNSTGGMTVMQRGICYSIAPNPTLSDSVIIGTSSAMLQLTGLTPGTTYYVRAFATNAIGTGYSNEISFTTLTIPTVITAEVSDISFNTATVGGEVLATGVPAITARGVCWSDFPNPTLADNPIFIGSGFGSFTTTLTELALGTTYYVRAFAINGSGTGYGDVVSFTTLSAGDAQFCIEAPTVTDIDGNIYNTVKIGQQCWMRENLRTMHYADGTTIPVGGDSLSMNDPYYYVNPDVNATIYGYYYNWPAAMHGAASSNANPSGVQGICPTGWHLPSDAEWTQLTEYVGSQSEYTCGGNNSYIAKALASTEGWVMSENDCSPGNDPSTNNASGFGAVPAGSDWGDGLFPAGYGTYFWSSTESYYYSDGSYTRSLFYDGENVDRSGWYGRLGGFSVRCLRD